MASFAKSEEAALSRLRDALTTVASGSYKKQERIEKGFKDVQKINEELAKSREVSSGIARKPVTI